MAMRTANYRRAIGRILAVTPYTLRLEVLLICACWAFTVAPCYAQAPSAEKLPVDPYLVVERFKFAPTDGAIMLPALVGNRACRFMLDTGARTSVLDKSLVVGAKSIKKGYNESTKESVELFAMPEGKLGNLELRKAAPTVAAFDLSKLSETLGYEVAGVLGFDFFSTRIVQIDFDREEVLILHKTPVKAGERMSVAFKSPARPTIRVKIGDSKTEDFLIDTGVIGFDSGCLRPRLVESLLSDAKGRGIGQAPNYSTGGAKTTRLIQARQVEVAGQVTPQAVFGEDAENLLSLNYLSRYCVTFDLGHAKVFFEPGKRIRQPDYADRSGLRIIRREGQAMIDAVEPGSAAAAAGIVAGDRLLFLGDIRGDTGPLHMMRGVLCTPDITVPVVIRRADREFMISLRLGPATLEPPK
jgi:hypothetical protein